MLALHAFLQLCYIAMVCRHTRQHSILNIVHDCVCRCGLIPGRHATICLKLFPLHVSPSHWLQHLLALRMFFQLCFSYCNAALSIAIHISSTKWYMASDRNVLIKWEGHCIVSRTVDVRERLCVSVARIWSRTSTYLPLCIQHSWEKAKWKSQIVKDTFNVLSFQQINRCFWLDSPCSGSRLPTTGRDLSCSSTRSSPWRTCGWSLIITQNTI